jgi:pSer/pThr/pTyr-binding forkhead associated (FHA) protein
MKLVFVLVVSGPLKGHKYFVKSDLPILIGRSDEANIRIAYDEFCSRKHALLFWEEDKCYVQDLNSTNGTMVNNEQIKHKVILKDGDIISLGDTQLSVFVKDIVNEPGSNIEEDITYDD